MELEQRVKTLEYELKILKSELQRTLLDIQEQILVHYYPSLRAEETTPPEGVVQSIADVRAKRANVAATDLPPVDEPSLPIVKKIKLGDVRSVPDHANIAPHFDAAAHTGTESDPTALIKLNEWLGASTAQIGSERTARIVALYGEQGLLKSETTALLLRITTLDAVDAPRKVAVNDMVSAALKLNEVLGQTAGLEETLALVIEEARRG